MDEGLQLVRCRSRNLCKASGSCFLYRKFDILPGDSARHAGTCFRFWIDWIEYIRIKNYIERVNE